MHHIDIHVRSIARSRELLDALMSGVGYTLRSESADYISYWLNQSRPAIGFIEDGSPAGSGSMRIAFAVPEASDVDDVARAVIDAGAQNVEGPSLHPEYGDDYYAVFFEDIDGNRFEILRSV